MLLPSRSTSMLIAWPHTRPSGSCAQFSTARYGLGALLTSWAPAPTGEITADATIATPSKAVTRHCMTRPPWDDARLRWFLAAWKQRPACAFWTAPAIVRKGRVVRVGITRARPRITRQLNSAIFSSSPRAAMAASRSVRGAAGDFIGLTVLAAATGGAGGTGAGFAEDGAATGDISGNATKGGSAGAAGTEGSSWDRVGAGASDSRNAISGRAASWSGRMGSGLGSARAMSGRAALGSGRLGSGRPGSGAGRATSGRAGLGSGRRGPNPARAT